MPQPNLQPRRASAARLTFAMLLSALPAVFGCSGLAPTVVSTAAPSSTTIAVSPSRANVQLGQSLSLTATVTTTNPDQAAIWQVAGIPGGDSAHGTISSAGVYTAPLAMPSNNTIIITAIAHASATVTATSTVTLSAPPVSVTLSPTVSTLQVSQTQLFSAKVQNDLPSAGVTWQVNGVTGGSNATGTLSTSGLYTAPNSVPSPATITITAVAVADKTKTATATVTIVAAPPAYGNLDRIDFGNAFSETAHQFANGDSSPQTMGIGAFSQTYRQPRLVPYPNAPVTAGEQLTFNLAVDPKLQNYVTVKLYGSDTQFGVLKVLQFGTIVPATSSTAATVSEPPAEADQLDNNLSNGNANPPVYGVFHFATLAIPQSLTAGKSSVTLTLYSTGYYYDGGGNRLDNPTRPVYSAFSHTNPYFVPPSGDAAGTPLTVTGYAAPAAYTASQVHGWEVNFRGQLLQPGNQGNNNGFFHPGGFLEHDGICPLPAGTPGAPPEVMGLSVSNMSYNGINLSLQPVGGQPLYGPPAPCQINAAAVAAINAAPYPADTWRNVFGSAGEGNQAEALDIELGVYLLPPLSWNGGVMKGYDDYHDPDLLAKIVGELDGLTRMYNGGSGGFDSSCLGDFNSTWAGITSSPRQTGKWTGLTTRQNPGCVSFEGGSLATIYTTVLRILNDPYAAPLFKSYLAASFDANLDGHPQPRAYAYERMGFMSRGQMFFDPIKATTSTNYFDKASITTTQGLIAQQGAYSGQLMLRALLALYPNTDPAAQPLDPALMKSIVRQFLGLDIPVVLVPLDTDWRVITAAGLGESHGTLSSGYDGRYGNYEAPGTGNLVYLSQWDSSLTAEERLQFPTVTRNCISAYDHYLYPQQAVSYDSRGNALATWTFAPEDVISYRVPYGPNADGGGSNWFTQLVAADPAGSIHSAYAMRSFFFGSIQNYSNDASGLGVSNYPLVESLWNSLVGVDPTTFPALPGEPGQPDFAWADVQAGAVAVQYRGERLFFNSQFQRPDGGINNFVRIHHITAQTDREATVMMPFDATTVQADGNLSGDVNSAWIVRYGRYLAVLNRSSSSYAATLPAGIGTAYAIQAQAMVPLGTTQQVPADGYEVFVLSQ